MARCTGTVGRVRHGFSVKSGRGEVVVTRVALSPSVFQVRRLVISGHRECSGRKIETPLAGVNEGCAIMVRTSSRENEYFLAAVGEVTESPVAAWLSVRPADSSGRAMRAPERDDIDTPVNEQLVVEY